MTTVLFRKTKDKDGDIVAIFPFTPWNPEDYTIACYMHIGQHGPCTWDWVRQCTKPASDAEFTDLLRELKSVGYDDLRVIRRLPTWSSIVEAFLS